MKKILFTILAAAFVVMLSGCNEMFNNDQADGKSRLVIKITDDPFDISYIESATVTITKVEIRRTGDGVPDGNPFMVLSDDTVTIDLIDLRNGLTETLIDMEIERHACLPQSRRKLQAVFHRHSAILVSVPEEARRRVLGYLEIVGQFADQLRRGVRAQQGLS